MPMDRSWQLAGVRYRLWIQDGDLFLSRVTDDGRGIVQGLDIDVAKRVVLALKDEPELTQFAEHVFSES